MIQGVEQVTEQVMTIEEELDRSNAELIEAIKVLADQVDQLRRDGHIEILSSSTTQQGLS
jgi:hypothetical protein